MSITTFSWNQLFELPVSVPQAEPATNQPLGPPQSEARLPLHWHCFWASCSDAFLFPFVCAGSLCVSVGNMCCVPIHTFVHTHIHIYGWRIMKRRDGFFFCSLSQVYIYLVWKGASPGGHLLPQCRPFLHQLCTQRGRRDREGLKPNLQCRLLIRAALSTSWFINVKKNLLKVPGNPCREHTPAPWSVNNHLLLGGWRQWRNEDRTWQEWWLEQDKKSQWGEGASLARCQGFLLNFVENKIHSKI